ncbi:MAG: RNA pseudouridine synthase, partial [Gammaproteobacteria bacterium]|nr:RNA pseudouridine synthase [Gammaproteobacteria bacterium]
MPTDIELHLPVESEQSALDCLAANCELSRTRLKQVMQCGAVWLTRGQNTKRLRRAKADLQVGDELHMYY